jgi:hypothetical protein
VLGSEQETHPALIENLEDPVGSAQRLPNPVRMNARVSFVYELIG